MNDIHIRDTTLIRRGLVADSGAKHYRRMRQAVWLYLFLLLAVPTRSGRRLLDPQAIARAMGLQEATVRSWLGHLRAHGYLTTERQGGLVWIQISHWREVDPKTDPKSPDSEKSGGMSPGKAERFAGALGEPAEIDSVARILEEYDSERVQSALDRALAVPQSQIRKSRFALFRYFLKQD